MKVQLSIDFSPKQETLKECIRRVVYGCGKPLKYIAAEVDMSPAELSRKLADNPNDPVHYPAEKLDRLVEATGGLDIVYWFVNRFLRDKEQEQQQAVNQLLEMLPKLKPLIETIESGQVKGNG